MRGTAVQACPHSLSIHHLIARIHGPLAPLRGLTQQAAIRNPPTILGGNGLDPPYASPGSRSRPRSRFRLPILWLTVMWGIPAAHCQRPLPLAAPLALGVSLAPSSRAYHGSPFARAGHITRVCHGPPVAPRRPLPKRIRCRRLVSSDTSTVALRVLVGEARVAVPRVRAAVHAPPRAAIVLGVATAAAAARDSAGVDAVCGLAAADRPTSRARLRRV